MAQDPNQQLVSATQAPSTLGTQSQGNVLTTDPQNGSSSSSQSQKQAAVNPNTLFNKPFPDFNNDGNSDVFWRNPSNQAGDPYSTTNNAVWLENGNNPATGAYLPTLDSNWSFSFGDFNGDSKSDIFWNNATTGQYEIWLMDGSTITTSTGIQTNSLGSGYTPTIADFNGDKKTDIFWRNSTTGDNQISLVGGDGTTLSSPNPQPNLGTDWYPTIVDFNKDQHADILWHNSTTGENLSWIQDDNSSTGNFDENSNLPTLRGYTPNVGDFNNDGRSDILWRNDTTGDNLYWIANGTDQPYQPSSVAAPSLPSGWTPKIGDFNGDGRTDVFWRNTSQDPNAAGQNALWITDNTTGTNPTGYFLPTLSTDWTEDFGDFNGDGRTDIFWRNNSTGQNAIWTSADSTGTNFTGAFAPSLPIAWKNYSS
ncbi:MAG: VCBS repeat-containing protein [Rhizonema sp. PD38]|nr:VCBS repeat-containing protein [Rhizonema sp. PD38]